jgi:hypothetical protein
MGRRATHRRPSQALTAALLGLTTAAAGAAIAGGLLATGGGSGGAQAEPIGISTAITPREHFFGDRVSAVVTVHVRPELIDPGTVSIRPDFAPYSELGRPVTRRDGGTVTLRARLVCLSGACVPKAPQRTVQLASMRVRFREGRILRTVAVPWPPLLVASRLMRSDLLHPALQTRLQPPPAPSADALLGWSLTGAAALLCLLVGIPVLLRLVGLRGVAGRGGADAAERGRALADAERLAAETDHDRRVVVDRLASALARAGLQPVAPQARALAWSRRPPGAESIRQLLDSIHRLRKAA